MLASPVIFLQIWRFVAPGLYKHEQKAALSFALISSICFTGGALFGYFLAFPPVFRFLLGYANAWLEAMPAVETYFSLALRLFLAFGLIFELPVFLVFLARAGLIDHKFLRKNRKYAVLLAFVVAAILTPTPDVVNQLFMAAPVILLYELGIGAVWLFGRRNTARALEKKHGQS